MSSIDEQFVEFIVKSLVSKPDAVVIERRVDEKGVLLELTVDPEDLGRIIGKRGATAQSLRTLLRALGTKNEARYNLKIVDNGPEGYERPARDETPRNDRPAQAPATTATSDDDEEAEEPVEQADNGSDNSSDAPVEQPEQQQEQDDEPEESSFAKRHRKDLEDLDDLDI